MSFDEFLLWIYKIGTGWLGWTPQITRSAHMQEVIVAFEGHVDMLKAIHGSDEKKKTNSVDGNNKKPVSFDALDKIIMGQ